MPELIAKRGQKIIVDDEQFERLPGNMLWVVCKQCGHTVVMGYEQQISPMVSPGKRRIRNTLACLLFEKRKNQRLVHKNGDPLDYRTENIELVQRDRTKEELRRLTSEVYDKQRFAKENRVLAPCGKLIVNRPGRCYGYWVGTTYHRIMPGPCKEYEWCLGMAIEKDWDGWRIA